MAVARSISSSSVPLEISKAFVTPGSSTHVSLVNSTSRIVTGGVAQWRCESVVVILILPTRDSTFFCRKSLD